MTAATKNTSFRPLVRDVLFAEIALREEKIPAEAIQKGWAVVKELAQFGIVRHLPSVLIERKLLDPKTEKEVVQYFARIKVSCALCRKTVSLENLDGDGRVRCPFCESLLGIELTGSEEGLPDKPIDKSKPKVESRLKTAVLQGPELAQEPGGKKAERSPSKVNTAKINPGLERPTPRSSKNPDTKTGKRPDTKTGKGPDPKPPKGPEKFPSKLAKGVESQSMPELAASSPARPRGEERGQGEESPQAKEPAGSSPAFLARAAIQRYHIESILSNGPYGRLYRAQPKRDADKNKRLVLKVISHDLIPSVEAAEQMQQELERWNQLHRELLTPIHALEQEGSVCYLVRNLIGDPFIPLATLRLNEWKEREELLRRITRALAKVHQNGRVHGNLKPSNLFLSRDQKVDQVLMVDPALHYLLPQNDNLLRWKVLADGPRYRSPEEIDGQNPTAASDVYALGWIFFAIIAGAPPFAGLPAPEVLRRHREGPCPELVTDHGEWGKLINAMTALNPKERPQSAAIVLGLIEEILGGKKLSLPRVTPRTGPHQAPEAGSRSKRDHFAWRYAAAPAVLVAAIFWVAWCFLDWEKTSAIISREDRNAELFQILAGEAFKQTRAESTADPKASRALWEKYLQTFAGTTYEGAAEAEKRNYIGPASEGKPR